MGRSSKAKQRLASRPKVAAAPPQTRRWQWVVFVVGLLALGAGGWCFWREWQAMSEARRGIELVRAQRYADALPILRKAYERSPRDIAVVTSLAQALIASSSLATDVEPILSRWCDLEPDNPSHSSCAWTRGTRSATAAAPWRMVCASWNWIPRATPSAGLSRGS
jgi:predicted Zn-dependent protease